MQRRSHTAQVIAALAITLVTAVTATGCGSASKKSATPGSSGATTTTAPAASEKLQIVVTNDDGYNAPGIDNLVEALRKLPNVDVRVVAPATQQSGQGPKTTPGPLTHHDAKTLSGYPAIAVDGHPADTIRVALDDLHLKPGLVVAGVNEGQNLGPLLDISGTVGAARAAAVRGIPALAVSQAFGEPVNYPVATEAAIKWITGNRASLIASDKPRPTVVNINAPSCGKNGKPRGTVAAPPATAGPPLNTADCTSTLTDPADDVIALNNGYIVVDTIPSTPAKPASS